MAKLQKAAVGKRLEFTLQRNEWRGGVELQLTAVRAIGAMTLGAQPPHPLILSDAGCGNAMRSGKVSLDRHVTKKSDNPIGVGFQSNSRHPPETLGQRRIRFRLLAVR
jgi:hypothetical protein